MAIQNIKPQVINPDGLYRMKQITKGDPSKGVAPIFPFSDSTFLRKVAAKEIGQPIRNGSMTFWRGSDLIAFQKKLLGS
ncbi:hypothetical protein NB640_11065 [Oxalobacter vibrioformis]|uniref:Uncharacterized protein n=1 Tax=Oxalobacter vibrioformis TaxID=933080 RepID=A0A9E9LW14_9BURK|nr:hypothetical protein [Oxalobacter vibrioformis]WAW09752.1 hypothetical protein NB640_11065 [Oxalobacter vibrioformis]